LRDVLLENESYEMNDIHEANVLATNEMGIDMQSVELSSTNMNVMEPNTSFEI